MHFYRGKAMQLEGLQIGSYRLQSLIGGGGMGDVYLAEDTRVNRQVAIKVIQTKTSSYLDTDAAQDAIHLFQREVKAIANLDHSHILPFFDCGAGNFNGMSITYMVMPFRREGSLLNWLRQHNPSKALSPKYVAHFLRQAADALQYAHDQQIIHRDVKPSNFLIRSNKEYGDYPDLLLADFGLAKFSTMTTSMSRVTRGNYGTPIYMAPEHWDGKPVPATDQYSLAVMVYELLTGRPPFLGNQQQVMYQHLQVQPQPPSRHNPDIPASLDNVILRALAKRPEDRFSSVTAFAQAFEQAVQDSEYREHLNRGNIFQQPVQGFEYSSKGRQATSLPITTSGKVSARRTGRFSSRVMPLVGLLSLILIAGVIVLIFFANTSQGPQVTSLITPVVQATSNTTATLVATATATPLQNPYTPHKGVLALYDPLHTESGYNWDEVTNGNGSCTFTGEAYHVATSHSGHFQPCTEATNFSNFVYQVMMTITTGEAGGIIFRVDSTHSKFYYFRIGQDGSFEFGLSTGSGIQVLQSGTSLAIKTGLNHSNLIAVVASGSNIDLYVNHQHIAYFNDSIYSQGQLGVCAQDASHLTEVIYSDALVWKL
jgi:serine/threonine protein kinase